jgi:hypothetical protein
MRLFKAHQPAETAEDRAAAVRLMAVANRSKGANPFEMPAEAKPECPTAN